METKQLAEERIDDLCDNFEYYVNHALHTYRLDTPARYFHIKTTDRLTRTNNLALVLDDSLFFDYLYATLVAWGMDSRGAKLCGFTQFHDSILDKREEILKLNKYSLRLLAQVDESDDETYKNFVHLVTNVLRHISVSATESKLVANTKALHHILPNLIPPIDRNFTLQFLFNNKAVKQGDKSLSQFFDVLNYYIDIYDELENQVDNMIEAHSWNSSVTKIIDNAIIGYCLIKLPRKK